MFPTPPYDIPPIACVSGFLFNVMQKGHQKSPDCTVCHPILIHSHACWPCSNLWLQAEHVSPLIKFSEEFLECVVTVGRICSLLRELSGISAVWLLKQFLNVHLLFRYTVKKKNPWQISKDIDTAFQHLSRLIFLDIFNLNRENFIQHLMSKYLEC